VGRRSGLGKGLGALIPATERLEDTDAALRELPVSEIRPNSYQPREHFDEEALVSLAASIQAVGVLQPVLVRQSGPQEYELIAGERRWRAARRAGLQTIPAIVRPTEDVRSLEQALVENLHREDLTPLEEAAAYQQLIEEFGHTQEEVAQRVGKSRSAVANTLRLLHLPPSIQRLLAEGQISAGHARALLGSPDRVYQEQLARSIVSEHLTVREVEDRVRQHAGESEGDDEDATAAPKEPVAVVRPAALLELEDLLSNHLDTRVQVSMGAKRGRVVVDFATLEDLERIYRVIVEGPESSD
jgi:ParB family transcriptional regulator, chromosome partitioning protein